MSRTGAGAQSAEDALISRYFEPLATHPGALGLRDDAAILQPPEGHELVLTKDAIVAGVHFFADDPPAGVARKALRVNLSDLAAKGAKPAGFLLALGVPRIEPAWLEPFAAGLGADAQAYGCPLLGGDTVHTTGPIFISITAFGTLPQGTMVRRAGAKPGDIVFVTGTVGDAALGLRLRRPDGGPPWGLDAAARRHLIDRYLEPCPRLALAEALRLQASAAMDVSDGLAGDLAKLCRASGVSAEVEVAKVPFSAAAQAALRAAPDLVAAMLSGGDDYEIVGTIPAGRMDAFGRAATAANVDVAAIGRITGGEQPPRFFDRDGRGLSFERPAFSHF